LEGKRRKKSEIESEKYESGGDMGQISPKVKKGNK